MSSSDISIENLRSFWDNISIRLSFQNVQNLGIDVEYLNTKLENFGPFLIWETEMGYDFTDFTRKKRGIPAKLLGYYNG